MVIASTRLARDLRNEEHFVDRVRRLQREFKEELAAARRLEQGTEAAAGARGGSRTNRRLKQPAFMGGVAAPESWNLNSARSLWEASHRGSAWGLVLRGGRDPSGGGGPVDSKSVALQQLQLPRLCVPKRCARKTHENNPPKSPQIER